MAGGIPCGFVLSFNDGLTLYFAGDTALFGDMKLFGELFDIDYAVLPIGDNYTMGPKDAILAAKFLKTKKLFPSTIIHGLLFHKILKNLRRRQHGKMFLL